METKQKEQLKRMMVFSGLGLLFILSLWFIFKPVDKQKTEGEQGLNQDVPQATTEKMTSNKLKAYELGTSLEREENSRAEMGRLSDYFEDKVGSEEEAQKENLPQERINTSVQRYEENNRLISSFYQNDPYEEEHLQMQQEIDELREQLKTHNADNETSEEERQLALMEKSYQMAAKYLPTNMKMAAPDEISQNKDVINKEVVSSSSNGHPAMEVLTENKSVVSSLSPTLSDSAFFMQYGFAKRNLGFHSENKATAVAKMKNTLRAVVDRTTTIQEGEYVSLRLLDNAQINGLRIPRGTRLIAQAKIETNRLRLFISSVEAGGHIAPLKLLAYDTDGQEGVFIPQLEDLSAVKEMGANIGNSMGTSFTFANSAKDQIISEVARGIMQGANGLLQKKLRTIKVTLKSGYKLFLVQTK